MKDEEGLDPADWDEVRRVGHRMVDDMVEYLRTVRERPAWQRPPDDVRERMRRPLPVEGRPLPAVYEDFRRDVLPFATGNVHPRFWGWVIGTGTAQGALAEMLAATVNPNVGGFDDGASLVEDQVLAWLKEAMGMPPAAGGILVSGGSMANLVGLAVARNARAGVDVRVRGTSAAPGLCVYASRETHSSVVKAVELLGLGREALRLLPVRSDFTLEVGALTAAVAADRARGLRPLAVVANAGTVNTGAVDDLAAVADLCAREGLWMHVDGAFGAMAALSPGLRPLLRGMERADSLAFDLHKWGCFPYEVGCALVRDEAVHREAFTLGADYLASVGGISGRTTRFADYGIQLSRGFRALKVWMGLREQGTARLGRVIAQNVEQARHLAARVEREEELELLAPVPLNVVCFRYVGRPRRDPAALDELNTRILVRLQEGGLAVPSSTLLDGRFAIRAAIVNHRTRRADLDGFLDDVLRLGRASR